MSDVVSGTEGYADEADLAERVMTAVARAGVPVEIGRSAAS